MTLALYRKWRPRRWDEVTGQDHIVKTLRNAVAAGRIAHAYLFAGPRGTGKTSVARILAKAANCLADELSARPCDACVNCQAVNEGRFLDLIEIDAASNTSVEDVRDLRDKINFSPNQGRYKVYIIDEVHMLSTAAFNALLKTLEEPPSHAIFILATTEVHKIPATVLSRCQRHEFRRIPVATMVEYLAGLTAGEGLQVSTEAMNLVARQATGSLRDAISLLDQLASTGEAIDLELAHAILGTATSQAVLDVVDRLLANEAARGLEQIHSALDAGIDPRHFARQIVEYLRNVLLIQMGNPQHVDATTELRVHIERHAKALDLSTLLHILRLFNQAASEARLAWQPALPLEMAFIESLGGISQRTDASAVEATDSPVTMKTPTRKPAGRASASETAKAKPPAEELAEPARDQEDEPAQESSLSMEMIIKKWPQVSAQVRQVNLQTQALFNSCKPMGMKDGVLILGFNSDFTRTKAEKPENLEVIQQAFAQVFGKEVPVRCGVAPEKKGAPPADIDSDGMVATALRDLGGEIVDIQ
jgi:DNA polymerase-3 subunit gamma/tau